MNKPPSPSTSATSSSLDPREPTRSGSPLADVDAPPAAAGVPPACGSDASPVAAVEELEPVFTAVAKYFALLSEPTRLRILHTICTTERTVTAIVNASGATQTNVSRHLGLMHQAGVVSRRRDGNAVYYQVIDPVFADICRTVCVQIASRIDERAPLRDGLLDFAQHGH
jgi:DNA-binding transcriptional ArsR family regulator